MNSAPAREQVSVQAAFGHFASSKACAIKFFAKSVYGVMNSGPQRRHLNRTTHALQCEHVNLLTFSVSWLARDGRQFWPRPGERPAILNTSRPLHPPDGSAHEHHQEIPFELLYPLTLFFLPPVHLVYWSSFNRYLFLILSARRNVDRVCRWLLFIAVSVACLTQCLFFAVSLR